ncbi:MAG TPA: GNAT family N-acetyltransferase [Nocardioides sp.]|nr:GNAT family N-acetyltransferase [Nocardioides sp.]
MTDVVIRPATDADLDAVAAIYGREVVEGHATFDIAPPPRSAWEAKLASAHPGDLFLVAADGDRVVGFAYSSAYREKGAYAGTRETTIYLDPAAGGRGLGRRLYDGLLDRMRAAGVHTALACLAVPNEASEALHRACGFERVGVMREVGRKFDRWIDVAWWQRVL